jgi:hypothetical protein
MQIFVFLFFRNRGWPGRVWGRISFPRGPLTLRQGTFSYRKRKLNSTSIDDECCLKLANADTIYYQNEFPLLP